MINQEYSKIMDCAERLGCLVEILMQLNNISFDLTCHTCDLDSSDEEIKASTYLLIKNQPRLNILNILIRDQIDSVAEISNVLSEEISTLYFGKAENE